MPAVGPDGVQVATGTLVVVTVPQVTVGAGVQVATGVLVTLVPQVVR